MTVEIGLVLVFAVLLLASLLKAEKTESPTTILLFKTPLSILFIVAWALQPAQNPVFSNLILMALLFCLGGDVLLAFGSRRTFLGGLVSFLLGHMVYAGAFFMVGQIGSIMALGAIALLASAAMIWRWLGPHLDNMQAPVLAYVVVISIMVCGALGVLSHPTLPLAAKSAVAMGALLFYLSDLCVARQRFIVSAHANRLLGLPLYYMAQFLLAFSAAWVPA